MTWVAQELLPWLALAFVVGVVVGALLSLTRVEVDRWVEVPVEPEAAPEVTHEPAPVAATRATPAAEADPVFPTLDDGVAPWEQDEAWSRPATPVRTSQPGSGARLDEWDDAAANWRSWADEATGRGPEEPEPLPGGGRRVAGATPSARSEPASEPARGRHAGGPVGPIEPAAPVEPVAPWPTSTGAASAYLKPDASGPTFPGAPPAASDADLFAADRAADGGPGDWDHETVARTAPDPVLPDVVVPPPSPVSDAELFAADRAAEVLDDEDELDDPEPERDPEPGQEPDPTPVRAAWEPDPVDDAVFPTWSEPATAEPEVVPDPEPLPPRVEESPFDAPSAGFVRRRRSEVHHDPAPEPVFPDPEPVLPDPEPVALAPEPEPEPEPEDDDRPLLAHGPAGPGSMYAPIDGSVPRGYPIKGQASTMLFYPKGARFYSRVVADVYFDTEEAAERAGFTRFDRRGSAAHVIRPAADD